MKKLSLCIFLLFLVSCSEEKLKKSAYDIKIEERIDNILNQKQIKLYYWSPRKDKKYSMLRIPGKTNIFLNEFDYVHIVYNKENLKIGHVGVITDMNLNKCLKERTKQMNIYIDKFDLKDANIFKNEIKTLNQETNIIARRTKIEFPKKNMWIYFTCYDATNYKGSERVNSDYRFEKYSNSYANWVRNIKKLKNIN
jgi:hypothetical protein|tara:strand:+ start:5 stop:592 length:588 start_codon:yes stop_codon:yes gene_type:complete